VVFLGLFDVDAQKKAGKVAVKQDSALPFGIVEVKRFFCGGPRTSLKMLPSIRRKLCHTSRVKRQ